MATLLLVSLLLFSFLLNMSKAPISSNEVQGDKLPSAENDFRCAGDEGRVCSYSFHKHNETLPPQLTLKCDILDGKVQ